MKSNDMLFEANITNVYEAEGGFDYYGFTRPDGSWVIMRKEIATNEFKYAIGRVDYDEAIVARASQNYKVSTFFKIHGETE